MKRPYTGESWTRFKTLMQKLTKRTAIVETRAKNNEDDIAEIQPKITSLQTKVEEKNPVFSQAPSPTVYNWDSKGNKYVESGGDSISLICAPYNKKGYWRFYGSSEMSILQDKPETTNTTGNFAYMYTIQPLDALSAIQVFKYYSIGGSYENHVYVRDLGNIYQNPPNQSTGWVRYTNSTDFPFSVEIGGTGWQHGLNSGVNIVPGTSDEWSNWITPVYNRQNSTGTITIVPYPQIKNVGDVYSSYIEIEFENVTKTAGQNDEDFKFIIQGSVDEIWSHGASNPIENWIYYPNFSGFPGKENGVRVYKKTKVISDPYYPEAKVFMIGWRADYWASGRFRYRCLKIERGYVDYPQWTPAPEDIKTEISEINDITTMSNLLKGTREFIKGTKDASYAYPYYVDGFRLPSYNNYEISIDENGFTIFTIKSEAIGSGQVGQFVTSVIEDAKLNETYTMFFDVMLDNPSGYYGNDLGSVRQIDSTNKIIQNLQFTTDVNGINFKNFEPNKWYKICKKISIAGTDNKNGVLGYTNVPYGTKGNVHFKKFGLFKGDINNPEWNASPLDYASSYETPALLGVLPTKNYITEKSDLNNYKLPGDYTSVSSTIAAGLQNCPTTTAFTMQVRYTVGTSSTYLSQRIVVHTTLDEFVRNTTNGSFNGIPWNQTYANKTVRPIEGGGTGAITQADATVNLFLMTSSYMNYDGVNKENDKNGMSYRIGRWVNNDANQGNISELPRPGSILSMRTSGQAKQLLFGDNDPSIFFRYGNDSTSMKPWKTLLGTNGLIPIETGGTAGNTVESARKNLKIGQMLDVNPISTLNQDTYDFWKTKDNGWYRFGTKTLQGQPNQWGFLYNLVYNNSDIVQFFLSATTSKSTIAPVAVRHATASSAGQPMPYFEAIDSEYQMPYVSGTYTGRDIATIHEAEIGSSHIANWLASRVSQGNFEGINIGDWVDIPCTGVTRRYVIAAIDPYYQQSQSRMGHHIVMVPNTKWNLDPSRDGSYAMGNGNVYILWNTTADNNGTATEQSPYLVSNLHKWELEVALKQFPQQWQDVMIDRWVCSEIRYSASSKLSNPTGSKWSNLGKLWSLSEVEFNGRTIRSSLKYGSNLTDVQFPIFETRKKAILMTGMTSVWLRDVEDGSPSNCCMFSYVGDSSTMISNYSGGLCAYPCFLLG